MPLSALGRFAIMILLHSLEGACHGKLRCNSSTALEQGQDRWTEGFKLKEVWAIRIRLQLARRERELALFDLGIESRGTR
jgi:hypothetical protein